MSSEKEENANSSNNFESSDKIKQLIDALYPLRDDITWIDDVIHKIKSVNFPETDFEISGLARIISYEIIRQDPELLTLLDTKITPLKELIIQYLNHISISKKRKEHIAKLAEEIFNKEAVNNNTKQAKIR